MHKGAIVFDIYRETPYRYSLAAGFDVSSPLKWTRLVLHMSEQMTTTTTWTVPCADIYGVECCSEDWKMIYGKILLQFLDV